MKTPMTDFRKRNKLTPDINGSYVNGTWSQSGLAGIELWPLCFSPRRYYPTAG